MFYIMFSVFFPMHNVPLSAFVTKSKYIAVPKTYTAFCITDFISGPNLGTYRNIVLTQELKPFTLHRCSV